MTPEEARGLLEAATPGPWRAFMATSGQVIVDSGKLDNAGDVPLATAAPALAELVASMHYEYAVQVEHEGKTYLLGETIDGPYPFDESSPSGPCWYKDVDSARNDAHAWNANPYEKGDASVVRRLVSDPEVAE